MTMQPASNVEFADAVEDAGGNLKARWSSLETPVKIAVVAGVAITFAVFARYILPAMLAAMGIGLVLAVLFLPYWLPTIIAFFRGHPNKLMIGLVNFLLGWTFVGWWVSLFWSLSSPASQPVSVVVNTTTVAGGGSINQGQPPVGAIPAHHQPAPAFNPQSLPAPQGELPRYQVGDVMNGHRFDGQNWLPLAQGPQQQIAPPPPE